MFFSLLKATPWVAFFLLLASLGWSKKSNENLETYKEQISKSQVLLLQRDRQQATQILIDAIHREGIKSTSFPELTKALQKTSEIFLSEKAQQSYEMAVASFEANKVQAIEKLRETLKLEPLNSLVQKALIFLLLNQKECQAAAKAQVELVKVNPFDSELDKLQLLNFVCQNSVSEARAFLGRLDPTTSNQAVFIVAKQRLGLLDVIPPNLEPILLKETNPEMTFVFWFREKNFKKRLLLGEKYKNQCHAPLSFDKAYGWMDPWACDHLKEIEEFSAKGEQGQ